MNASRGFSLAEVIVASGLLAVSALGVMHLMKNQKDSAVFIEAKNEEISVFRNIDLYLSSQESCFQTLNGLNPDSNVLSIKNAIGTEIYKVGIPIQNRILKIASMRLINQDIPATGGYGTATLLVTIERLKKGIGAKSVNKAIVVNAKTDNSGHIEKCFGGVDGAILTLKTEMCENLGGIYNSVSGKCTLSSVTNTSDTEVVSKKYLDDTIQALKAELASDYISKNISIACPSGDVLAGVTGGIPSCVSNGTEVELPATCAGDNVRIRYLTAAAYTCYSEVQIRSCNDGAWGEWVGTYTHDSCTTLPRQYKCPVVTSSQYSGYLAPHFISTTCHGQTQESSVCTVQLSPAFGGPPYTVSKSCTLVPD